MVIFLCIVTMLIFLYFLHFLSYFLLKTRIMKKRKWDLNICCGKMDGGGINVDIICYKDMANFLLIQDIYHLPFKNKAFDYIVCSHTMEHVDDPQRFYKELKRVGNSVVLVLPPLWDILAVVNIWEHKWIFLTFRKEHTTLPSFVPLPFANRFQQIFGQRIKA